MSMSVVKYQTVLVTVVMKKLKKKLIFLSKWKSRNDYIKSREALINLFIYLFFKSTKGPVLTTDQITKLIVCLRDNIHSPDRKQLTRGLLELRTTLLAAAVPVNSLQAVLFSFQDAVSFQCYSMATVFSP